MAPSPYCSAYAGLILLPLWALWRHVPIHWPALAVKLPPPNLRSLALFGQMIFGALCGLEYIAILAGESKHAARSIGQSVWISSPIICAMFILGTSSVVAFSQSGHIDFIAPIPQTVRLALGNTGLGNLFAMIAILFLQMRLLAAASYLFTGRHPSAHGCGLGQAGPGLVYPSPPTLADAGELHPMHISAYFSAAGAGERSECTLKRPTSCYPMPA